MRLIDKNAKHIMEECKKKARDFGLQFQDDTLEYIVSNQDMIELEPKVMIPTMYDFWLQDVQVHRGKGMYQLYPHNPYETVINTKPPISFYNTDNPDWMNCAIFYHVLGHIDFFQNNEFFSHTWKDDLCGKALAQKRRINEIRKELGEDKRWVDYIIEFTRQIDNLVNIHKKIRETNINKFKKNKLDYYFSDFLKSKELSSHEYLREIENYNSLVREYGEETAKVSFFKEIERNYPEFQSIYDRYVEKYETQEDDLIDFLINNSKKVNKSGNEWMKEVMMIVKEMAEFLDPQKYTKNLNEGLATYIHNKLFLQDSYINGHESDFARFNANVIQTPKVGLNPYALGFNLLNFIEELGDKGKLSYEYQKLKDFMIRKEFDKEEYKGKEAIFDIRRKLNDVLFLDFLDKDNFQEFVDKNKLYVADRKLNMQEGKWEYYIKSRNGEDYRNMVLDKLPHPPKISYYVNTNGYLILDHKFEGKQLHKDFIPNVLKGIKYLWGDPVVFDTTEFDVESKMDIYKWLQGEEIKFKRKRVRYTIDEVGKYSKRDVRVED